MTMQTLRHFDASIEEEIKNTRKMHFLTLVSRDFILDT